MESAVLPILRCAFLGAVICLVPVRASSALIRFPAYGGHTGGGVVVAQQLAIETAVFISLPFCAQVHLTKVSYCLWVYAGCAVPFDLASSANLEQQDRASIPKRTCAQREQRSGYQQIYQSSYVSGSGAGVLHCWAGIGQKNLGSSVPAD